MPSWRLKVYLRSSAPATAIAATVPTAARVVGMSRVPSWIQRGLLSGVWPSLVRLRLRIL